MHSFGTHTSKEKLEQLLEQYEDFKSDDTSIRKANDLSINSWHIIDWIFEEFKNIHLTSSIGDFRATLYPLCQSLKIMHDIANSAKHSELTRPKAAIKEIRKHLGPFSSVFSREFDQTILEIEMLDGSVIYFVDEIEKVIEFWKDYFKTKLNIEINI